MAHILLDRAVPYTRDHDISVPEGFVFSRSLGAWYSTVDGTHLVERPGYPGGGTKKNDIETGEDQKGQ